MSSDTRYSTIEDIWTALSITADAVAINRDGQITKRQLAQIMAARKKNQQTVWWFIIPFVALMLCGLWTKTIPAGDDIPDYYFVLGFALIIIMIFVLARKHTQLQRDLKEELVYTIVGQVEVFSVKSRRRISEPSYHLKISNTQHKVSQEISKTAYDILKNSRQKYFRVYYTAYSKTFLALEPAATREATN